MTTPRIPYDEVRSPTIREAIRSGSFHDQIHRRYVDDLVYLEWYTRGGLSPNATGHSAAVASFVRWRIATTYPEAYDAVRRDLDASTRAEYRWRWNGEENPSDRRRRARRDRDEWDAVAAGTDPSEPDDGLAFDVRPSFAPFRFPRLGYHHVESSFVRGEIARGSFDDLEYRRYVNRLVAIEAFTRHPKLFACGAYPPVTPWIVAAGQPHEFDIIRRELDASTRAHLEPRPTAHDPDEADPAAGAKRAWRAVLGSR